MVVAQLRTHLYRRLLLWAVITVLALIEYVLVLAPYDRRMSSGSDGSLRLLVLQDNSTAIAQ
jgi:ABC-type protease/lipase transport system fused ATPase/permease subunit